MVTILALTGLFLLYLEFFLPGAIMAVGGGMLLLASLVHFYLQTPDLLFFFIYFVCLCAAVFLTVRLGLATVAKKKMKQERDFASVYPQEMVGKTALAASDLNPNGFVLFEDRTFPASSGEGSIGKGSAVRIVGGEGTCFLVVRETPLDAAQ